MNVVRGGALTALALLVTVGCGTSESNPASKGDAPTENAPNGDDSAPSSPSSPPPPSVDGVPVEGIFVSASKGHDDADGSMARPLQTIAKALQMTAQKKTLPIVVCAETYAETISNAGQSQALALYGYYDCSTDQWKKGGGRAKIAPTDGIPVTFGETQFPIRMEGFDIVASDRTGTATGGNASSSFGMLIVRANVQLADVSLAAGKGQDGADGEAPTVANGFTTPASAVGGKAGGKVMQICNFQLHICNFDSSLSSSPGAKGGAGTCMLGESGGSGSRGGAGRVSVNGAFVAGYSEAFSVGESTPTAGPGQAGANGARGTFGANGTWSFGSDGNFVPGNGTDGDIGQPGGGGGGGNGVPDYGSSSFYDPVKGTKYTQPNPPPSGTNRTGIGGGGGAGGCGGTPGKGGYGGGASIGLVVHDGTVTLTNVTLKSGNGGRGGSGSAGSAGTPGGAASPADAAATNPGTPGGAGGSGGAAGQSGHGAPGPSLGLAYHGARPTTTNVQLHVGSAGAAGAPVEDGAQKVPAPPQVAQEEYSY